MKPTDFVDQSHIEPTVPLLVDVATANGLDRVSLVRRALPFESKATGVAVVMIGSKALREVGPFLHSHVAKLPLNQSERFLITLETPVRRIFEAMHEHHQTWSYTSLTFKNLKVVLLLVVGESVTEEFAAALTRLGCTTNLK
ncbi:MAG TPA: hypothetical protein VH413_16090 [Verrucomicrobiae bacterium]|jgi:hypothetical protein|nr:hypothetical protein [Verrucomicrobiae bacterium]